MKKIIIVILIAIFFLNFKNIKCEELLIPDEAIRLRVIANSNTEYDQNIKLKVRDEIQKVMYNLLKNTTDINQARLIINDNLELIDDNIKNILSENNYFLNYTLDFGDHYFPEKKYKGVTYEEGNYESLLITLGEGEGNNWWCVLFPPLCLIEAEESDEVEYKFFVQELIEKYF